MKLVEGEQLYKGVFWIVDLENMHTNSNYCFTIPSDEYGNVQADELYLNAKSGTTYNSLQMFFRWIFEHFTVLYYNDSTTRKINNHGW